ncbi:hypothetical protein PTI98_011652 [Pleurotus ostreatus]|nr:hypothetical protein PTI98_011652 [Pleurotus ostreatus]
MPKRREYLLQRGWNLLGGLKSIIQKVSPKKKKKNKSLKEQSKENVCMVLPPLWRSHMWEGACTRPGATEWQPGGEHHE